MGLALGKSVIAVVMVTSAWVAATDEESSVGDLVSNSTRTVVAPSIVSTMRVGSTDPWSFQALVDI